ncbi:WD40/YVTN/BNR-like repeat-containing protein [Chryseobacterium sp. MFBS3-17]|uniref:WD40/YVTN/BNR-like repeat-containing protein n=1 Tax=Chryseobacterium sp. MFBS3-17 TaxID=2886689 RepID=UPI001D0E2D0D|nr:glycosyl hydrolase [Chryseobacterium sp. MFBS3-17]MCC2589981.1 glycosyl hydrolase [Chryseobacterium sp. MFBS3-17]
MKKLGLFLLSIWAATFSAQQVKILLEDSISIRAIVLEDQKVWYAGTDSKFGYVNILSPADQRQIRLSDQQLQFRTLAQDRTSFYAINIESPAHLFKISKRDLTHQIVFTDTARTAFYDAMHFVNGQKAYAFSDADESLNLKLLQILPEQNSFAFYRKPPLKMNKGEAAFAASNSNLASAGKYLWLGTGGGSARIFRFDLQQQSAEIFETGFVQDSGSAGIYSIDFLDEQFGIAVGGDYTRQEANINNIATTSDGGQTWQIQASGKNGGYKTCVKIRPDSGGREIVAVGDQQVEYSHDYGQTWIRISEEKGFYVCEWLNASTLILAGKGKIAKMEF